MTKQLEPAYQPKTVETKIYQRWEKSGFFNPDNLPGKRTKPYSIAMPPPNVTGELHLGHATGLTIQDILIRYHRMRGYKTLYIPGTDHAGISTQIMVERLIEKSGLDKHSLGREAFLKQVWAWKKKYGSHITQQIRQLGTSCDWSREHFTMDEGLNQAVQKAFVTMYNDGLIYRGNRIVNWDAKSGSALSDLEVKHVETTSKLYFIKYPLFGSTKYVTVATTRPETMLGDTALAVNPKDKRYSKLIGKTVLLPIVEREIPIVADKRVDLEFGTGVVKITPAHDHLDYEIGIDHKLEIINVIGTDGRMTKEAGEYFGKSVQDARHEIVSRLEREEFLEKTVDYVHNQARSERSNAPIEPLISDQWYVKVDALAKKARQAVRSGKIKIVPQRYDKVFFHWMDNIKDWCISRQLWWGHQIPIWYNDGKVKASATKPAGKGWIQDEDTLDTWFSSGLWTFSTLGWPKKTKDLQFYHPTTVMETGWDILFFWVARMMMMSLYLTKEVPFKTVYLHGLVLDRHGKKMSKSKGTGVDPIPMTEKYGTDAIRLSLILGTAAGQDFRLYEEKIAGYRNFINKLWNVSRFILAQPATQKTVVATTVADKWILSRLQGLIKTIDTSIAAHRFSEAGTALYDFLWHELADWYLEMAKTEKNPALLHHVLDTYLRLTHPFIPFVTEEIWSRWKGASKQSMLMVQQWPTVKKEFSNPKAEKEFSTIQEFISQVRNFRAEHKIPATQTVSVDIWGPRHLLLLKHADSIQRLARIESLGKKKLTKITGSLTGLDYLIDYKKDKKQTQKEIVQLSQYIQKLENKLANKNFIDNAPQSVIAEQKKKLAEQQSKLKKLL